MITGDFVQLATAGATKTQTVYKDIENINNYKMVALYCNYSSGYYCNPLICSVELFKTMTWITSDSGIMSDYVIICNIQMALIINVNALALFFADVFNF